MWTSLDPKSSTKDFNDNIQDVSRDTILCREKLGSSLL